MPTPSHTTRKKTVKAWADIGSHGHIFAFANGNYPNMMHIYTEQVTKDLIPVTISYQLVKDK